MPWHDRLAHLAPLADQPIVFLTTVTDQRRELLNNSAAFHALTGLWQRSAAHDGWYVGDYMLMPDHVHLFARAARDARSLGAWVKAWKSVSARSLESASNWHAHFWQRDYFDRFLRSADSYSEKWHYVSMNPVRKGLCQCPEDWPWKGRVHDLSF